MDLPDLLRRYFVGNTAPIFSVRKLNLKGWRFTPYRIGNAGGFYWGPFEVSWRRPYSKVWAYDSKARQWMPAYMIRPTPPSAKD